MKITLESNSIIVLLLQQMKFALNIWARCAIGRAHKRQCVSCYKAPSITTVLGPYSDNVNEGIASLWRTVWPIGTTGFMAENPIDTPVRV